MKISVVIPTLNRKMAVERCLESVLRQSFAPLEILVVDNGSQDGTPEFLGGRYRGRVRVLAEARPGVSSARNRGIDSAAGDAVAFIDDDATAGPDWLEQIADCFRETRAAGVGGPTRARWESAPPEYLLRSPKALSYIGVFNLGGRRKRLADFRDFLIGTNCAFLKRVFDDGHRFLPELNRSEDLEFSRRIAARYPVFYDPRVVVEHHIPSEKTALGHLLRMGYRTGMSKAAIGRPLSPRGWQDFHGIDGLISLCSVLGYVDGSVRKTAMEPNLLERIGGRHEHE